MAKRTCENCGFDGDVNLYDIGSGLEWNCPGCDLCYGAFGQVLDADDVWRIPQEVFDLLPPWSQANPRWQVMQA